MPNVPPTNLIVEQSAHCDCTVSRKAGTFDAYQREAMKRRIPRRCPAA